MEGRRIILIAASVFVALVMGIFSNIVTGYIAPAFADRAWLVWTVVLVTFIASVVLTSWLDKSGKSYGPHEAVIKLNVGRVVLGALIGAVLAPVLFTVVPSWRYVVLEAFSFITGRVGYEAGTISLFFAVLGAVVGIIVALLFEGLVGAIVGGIIGVFLGVFLAVMFGGIVVLIIYFGEWGLIKDKIGSLAMWGLGIGGALGALGGFVAVTFRD